MATWTNVPDSNLEPGDPIRSVDIIAIKENTVYNYQHTTLEILAQQTFTTPGTTTWTKPGGFDATDSVVAVMIGGGGSGGIDVGNPGGGGGGGGVCVVSIPYASVASTVSVTVGSGGAAVTGQSNGIIGGKSTFGTYAGASGGQGGTLGGVRGPGGGALLNTTNDVTNLINGGSGRSGTDGSFYDGFTGGGGGFVTSNTYYIGVTSPFFGSGGNGATWPSGAATAGSAPGGGGGAGGSSTNVSGAGARGEVQVYVVRGKVSANTFLGTLTINVAY